MTTQLNTPPLRIDVTLPGGEKKRFEISELPASIGRSTDCSIYLQDRRVSRHHAELRREADNLLVVDLGSRNGVYVDGVRIEEQDRFGPANEIRIGDSSLRLADPPGALPEADDPSQKETATTLPFPRSSDASPEQRTEPRPESWRSRWRRFSLVAIPILVLGGVVGAVGWVLYQEHRVNADRVVYVEKRLPDAAQRDLDALRTRVREVASVDLALVQRSWELAQKYRDLEIAGTRPFQEIYDSLRARHDLEVENVLQTLSSRRLELIRTQRYGELALYAEEVRARLVDEAPLVRDKAEKLLDAIDEALETRYRSFLLELKLVEAPEFHEECYDLYAWGRHAFAGTPWVAELESRLEGFRAAMERWENRVEEEREELLARRREAEREHAAASARKAEPVVIGLSALIGAALDAGRLKAKPYTIGDVEGHLVRVERSGELVIERAVGNEKSAARDSAESTVSVSFLEIPAAVQVALAEDGLEGEALYEAAEYAFEWQLDEAAGRLLYAFLKEKGAPRAERQQRIDELLARTRDLGEIPEGGYEYDRRYGWEDAAQIRGREAVALAGRHIRYLVGARTVTKMKKEFAAVTALLGDESLPRSSVGAIRRRTIEALVAHRRELADDVARRSKNVGFSRIRRAKVELNERRRTALQIIRDAAIYLPENHPDYGKGDVVNGQRAVDEAVDAVRELWDEAGKYALQVDRTMHGLVTAIKTVDETFFPELRHHLSEEEKERDSELWNNVGRSIDLKSFALDRTEALLFEYNRKVEAFNRDLESPDVSEGEKSHVAILNDYREMLGLRRCFIDVRLCRATRKHSETCNRAGDIWHVGADGSPQSRARAEGFPGGVAENVARGYANPADIWWRGWYRASDHHRNAIGSGWTCIGYGYAGSVGTQNFSSISPPFR